MGRWVGWLRTGELAVIGEVALSRVTARTMHCECRYEGLRYMKWKDIMTSSGDEILKKSCLI